MQRSTKLLFLASAVGWPAIGTDFSVIPIWAQLGWAAGMMGVVVAAGASWMRERRAEK